jgi:hypothetical protein
MPNHCYNQLQIAGPGIRQFLDAIKNGDAAIDFNRIVPMPEILIGTCAGDRTTYGRILLGRAMPKEVADTLRCPWVVEAGVHSEEELKSPLLKEFPDCKATAELSLKAEAETGYRDWYEWANAQWGTKWNAFAASVVKEQEHQAVIRFSTAWSAPLPLIQTLSNQWPHFQFVLDYDEFQGGFSGTLTLRGGKGRWVEYDLELMMLDGSDFDDSDFLEQWRRTEPRVDKNVE